MNRCLQPKVPGDARYVHCTVCTWHNPITAAAQWKNGQPCCPECGGGLVESVTEEEFWAMARKQESQLPGYEAMLRWSQGKSFPDFDTLQNAYRQAVEGTF